MLFAIMYYFPQSISSTTGKSTKKGNIQLVVPRVIYFCQIANFLLIECTQKTQSEQAQSWGLKVPESEPFPPILDCSHGFLLPQNSPKTSYKINTGNNKLSETNSYTLKLLINGSY